MMDEVLNPVWALLLDLVQYDQMLFRSFIRRKLYPVQDPFKIQLQNSRISSCFKQSSSTTKLRLNDNHDTEWIWHIQIPCFVCLPIRTASGLGRETLPIGCINPLPSYLHYEMQKQTQNRREACRWSGLATWHSFRLNEPSCSLESQTTQQRSHNEQFRPRTHAVVGELTKVRANDEFTT